MKDLTFLSKRSIVAVRGMAMMVLLLFFGALNMNAQSIEANVSGEKGESIFADYDFQERNIALSLLQTELKSMFNQGTPVGGTLEAQFSLKQFFVEQSAEGMENELTVQESLDRAYSRLQVQATAFNGVYALEAMALEVADLLD